MRVSGFSGIKAPERGFAGILAGSGLEFVRAWTGKEGRRMLCGVLDPDSGEAPVVCRPYREVYEASDDERYILVGRDGSLVIGETWFDKAGGEGFRLFSDGSAIAERNGYAFYIGYDGKPVGNLMFDRDVWTLHDRSGQFAIVDHRQTGLSMLMSADGAFPEFGMAFEAVGDFAEGYAEVRVRTDDGYQAYYIDDEGMFCEPGDDGYERVDDDLDDELTEACEEKAESVREDIENAVNACEARGLRYW